MDAATTVKVNAGIYVRISRDQKDGAGIERQEKSCRTVASLREWEVFDARTVGCQGEVFSDNDISAWREKTRPDYRRMLKAIKAGEIQAIISWHQDRVTRRTKELDELLRLLKETGCKWATVNGGDIDPSTATGEMLATIIGAVAQQESAHKSERILSAKEQARERGVRSGGSRPYGYVTRYERDEKGKVIRSWEEVVESEAEVIREMARRLLAREPWHAVAHDLNRRGIPTAKGNTWSHATMQKVLANARISGRVQQLQGPGGRAFREGKGDRKGKEIRVGRIFGPAKWPAIISVEDSDRLRALIAQPKPRGRPVSYLLTGGIAVCGICGHPLRSLQSGGVRRLICLKQAYYDGKVATRDEDPACGRIAIQNAPVEENVVEAVLRAVEKGALKSLLSGPDTEAHNELAKVNEKLIQNRRDYDEDLIDRAVWKDGHERLTARQKELERRLQISHAHDGLEALPNPLRPVWPGLEPMQKREVVKALVDAVVIAPALRPGPQRKVLPQRITIRWKKA